MRRDKTPEPLDFFIWTVEDVGLWLEEINLGSYRRIFEENSINGEYLEGLSMFTTEQILRFIRQSHMKWGDFITLCKELRRIKGTPYKAPWFFHAKINVSLCRIHCIIKCFFNVVYLKLARFVVSIVFNCICLNWFSHTKLNVSLFTILCIIKCFFYVFYLMLCHCFLKGYYEFSLH